MRSGFIIAVFRRANQCINRFNERIVQTLPGQFHVFHHVQRGNLGLLGFPQAGFVLLPPILNGLHHCAITGGNILELGDF